HVKNFLALATIGFYNGLTFHRVVPRFVIQGGCPDGTGTGDAGYKVDAEFNDTPHDVGVLSMARASDPNSASSQFFICLARFPHLDRHYSVFGRTADRQSIVTVQAMGAIRGDERDRPRQRVIIEKATVVPFERSWLTLNVRQLLAGIHERRDCSSLPILG